jgi:hypothetical protein
MVEFERRDTLGGGFTIDVLNQRMLAGQIRKRPDTGAFRYYRGVHNQLTPADEDLDLEALKRRVKQNP